MAITSRPHARTPGRTGNPALDSYLRSFYEANFAQRKGWFDCTSTLTLTANAGSTVLTDYRLSAQSAPILVPTTANAAGALATTYVSSRGNGTCTFTHANNAQADKSFIVVILG